jgi:hypothetical protein
MLLHLRVWPKWEVNVSNMYLFGFRESVFFDNTAFSSFLLYLCSKCKSHVMNKTRTPKVIVHKKNSTFALFDLLAFPLPCKWVAWVTFIVWQVLFSYFRYFYGYISSQISIQWYYIFYFIIIIFFLKKVFRTRSAFWDFFFNTKKHLQTTLNIKHLKLLLLLCQIMTHFLGDSRNIIPYRF